jgi:hypothetical protein
MLGAISLSKAAPCMYTVSVYKLAHIRAVHTINETGHGYGLSLGAGFLSFSTSQGRVSGRRRAGRRCVATSDMSYSMIG